MWQSGQRSCLPPCITWSYSNGVYLLPLSSSDASFIIRNSCNDMSRILWLGNHTKNSILHSVDPNLQVSWSFHLSVCLWHTTPSLASWSHMHAYVCVLDPSCLNFYLCMRARCRGCGSYFASQSPPMSTARKNCFTPPYCWQSTLFCTAEIESL